MLQYIVIILYSYNTNLCFYFLLTKEKIMYSPIPSYKHMCGRDNSRVLLRSGSTEKPFVPNSHAQKHWCDTVARRMGHYFVRKQRLLIVGTARTVRGPYPLHMCIHISIARRGHFWTTFESGQLVSQVVTAPLTPQRI